jgi:hypothetical protein
MECIVWEYRFNWMGRLIVSPIGGEAFSAAIKSGALRGKIDGFTPVVLHERPGKSLRFIENSRPQNVALYSWSARRIGKR